MMRLQWLFSLALLASMPTAHAIIPVSFENAATKADKVALVKVLKVERRKLTVEVKDVFKGHFKSKTFHIYRPEFLSVKRPKPNTELFVLLNFVNYPFWGLSSCGTNNAIVVDFSAGKSSAEKTKKEMSDRFKQLFKGKILVARKPVFNLDLRNYDKVQYKEVIPSKTLTELIARIDRGKLEDAKTTVKKILSSATKHQSLLKTLVTTEGIKFWDNARLRELMDCLITVTARRQFLQSTKPDDELKRHLRNNHLAYKGATVSLRMERGWQAPKDLKKADYCLGYRLFFETDLITKEGSYATFEEVLYDNGTLIKDHFTGWTGNRSPLAPLVASKGKVKHVKGALTFRLPLEMRCRVYPLPMEKDVSREGAYFFKSDVIKEDGGWSMTYDCSVKSRGIIMEADLGFVMILDTDGSRLKEDWRGSGGGTRQNSNEGYVKTDHRFLKVDRKPTYAVWIYPVFWEDVTIPLKFADVQCPPRVWEWPYKK